MADFQTHVTFSSLLGGGYAAAGLMAGVDPATAFVAGGLCGLSGMLPDIDSDSGVPRRESMGFIAGVAPMLLVDRFRQVGMSYDQMVLTTAAMYFFIRFVASHLIGRFSVHRGMFHSIPAALTFAGLAFLITGTTDLTLRYFKSAAVFLGVMSHLILDEVYSIDTRGLTPKFKKSFGTAVKLWGKEPWANVSAYAKLAAVVAAIGMEPAVIDRIERANPRLAARLGEYSDRVHHWGDAGAAPPAGAPPTPRAFMGAPSAPPAATAPVGTPLWGSQAGFVPSGTPAPPPTAWGASRAPQQTPPASPGDRPLLDAARRAFGQQSP